MVYINVDLVCNNFRGGVIIFKEVMITFCIFIGYEPQTNQNGFGYREGMEESERGIRGSVAVVIDFR